MSKKQKITGLEAFNYIAFNCYYYANFYKHCEIVEKELKALAIIKKYYYGGGCLFGEMSQVEFDFVSKVLSDRRK